MSDTRKFLRRAAGLFLVLALLLPLAGPGTVLEASAVTKAEIAEGHPGGQKRRHQ